VTFPLAPRTARAIDLVVGERVEGPIFCPHPVRASTATGLPGWSAESPSAPASRSRLGRTP
jgi:hypothetical protein